MDRAELKAKAKKSLKGNYASAILILIVYGILVGLPLAIASFFRNDSGQISGVALSIASLVELFITSFLSLGAFSFFLKISRNKKAGFGELFSKTNLWVSCLVAIVMISIFTSLWTLLLIIPGIIASYRYRMTFYVLADKPKTSGLEAITRSKELMRGHKMELFVLDLSFIGWNILAVFTFGLLNFWLVPYMNTTYANYYNALVKNKKK